MLFMIVSSFLLVSKCTCVGRGQDHLSRCVFVCACLTCVEAQNKRRLKGWRRVKLIQDSNEGDGLQGSSWIILNRDIKDMVLSLILNVGCFPAKCWKVILMWNSSYEGRSEINASYFIMLAHDVRGEYCWYGSRGW